MKKALIYVAVIFFLFIIVTRSCSCSGCKKHKPAANNDNVSQSADSDIESGTPDDSVVDDSSDSELNEEAPSGGTTIVESNPNNAVVIVEGAGETLAEAKKDALRCAVEEVVGSLVDAQSRVENDELIEQILTASSAYVEKYSVLSRKIDNGLATVKIRATVVKESLTKKLKQSKGGQTVAIDGASLAGKAATKSESEKNGALFLANFLRKEEFPYSLFDVEFVGKPIITQKGNEIEYTVDVKVSVNRERYMDFIKRLKPILEKYALSHNSFVLDTIKDDDFKDNNHRYVDLRVYPFGEPNLPFCICTRTTDNYQTLKFDTYALPRKFVIPLEYYVFLVPAVNISLYDSASEEIATKRFRLYCTNSYGGNLCFFNLMHLPRLHSFDTRIYSEKAGESETIKRLNISSYANHKFEFWKDLVFIAPYAHALRGSYGSTYTITPQMFYKRSITLSPKELENVKSATVSVIVNNPDMDNAYERMESEIDQVPTN